MFIHEFAFLHLLPFHTELRGVSGASTGIIIIICYLADTFFQSTLQLIRLSRGQSPLEKCGVKSLAQGPNSCVDLTVAALGLEPPTPVMYLSHPATGFPPVSVIVVSQALSGVSGKFIVSVLGGQGGEEVVSVTAQGLSLLIGWKARPLPGKYLMSRGAGGLMKGSELSNKSRLH